VDFGLKNKTALVLGAGGGLGGAIARSLANEGANLALADIARDSLEATAKSIEHSGAKTLELQWDLGDPTVIEDRISKIEDSFGGVDILVNNTGGPPPTPAHGQSPDVWRKHFESMVLSVIAITDRVLPNMVQAKWGRITGSILRVDGGLIASI
jgi:3-oxoacyl-[acyl-carrier protein] reductase